MKKDSQGNEKINSKEEPENNQNKKSFFKKVWYSIDKLEKYPELSAEGFRRAMQYIINLLILISIVFSACTIYKTSGEVKNIAKYINEKFPELTYKDETMTIDSKDPIIEDNQDFGKIVIDTNVTDEQKINQYINEANQEENEIIILKDKLIIKGAGIQETVNYSYKDLFSQMGITEFNKQQLVEYLTSSKMNNIYLNLFVISFMYSLTIYLLNTLMYVLAISIVGYLATRILKLKIRYVAVFNMAIYAVTLPTILDMIYIVVNTITNFTIGYFDVMYMLVASIYLIAAIFMLKSEFDKKQGEIQKIVEVEKVVKEEIEKQEEKKQNKETKKKGKDDKEDSEKEDKKDTENGGEAEGSNA